MEENIYSFKATASNGEEIDFAQYKGKVLLIINTASKCGFTPQFDGLEKLNEKYRDQGLVCIGFPCNQFANQDPGSDSEIEGFCRLNYGVTFQIMKKIDVNGDNAHPIYKYLKSQAKSGLFGTRIKWNFTKFLVSRDGKTIRRFGSTVTPEKLESEIEKMLAQPVAE
ncbi:MAG: glutathione peroxidase [Bacteroidales bacterium]|nr:glutathione peroxidase [Bacteroidales bacterium]